MKYSIKQQIAFIFILVMAGTIALCWTINNIFLENYYIKNKKDAVRDAYKSINEAFISGDIASETFDMEFRRVCDMYNIDVLVIDAESNITKTNFMDTRRLKQHLYDIFFLSDSSLKYLENNDKFCIAMVMDVFTSTEYLEMWGVLENGNLFLIRSPVESIRDSVKIANKFLACGCDSNAYQRCTYMVCRHKDYKADYAVKRYFRENDELKF